MDMLIKRLDENEKFKQYILDVKNKISPISLSGLSDVGKAHIISGTYQNIKKPVCIVTYNEMQARKLIKDLQFFASEININSNQIVYIPKKEISPYDYESQSKELPYERIDAFNKIYEKQGKIIVTTIESLMQKLPEKELLYKNVVLFKVGENYQIPNNDEYHKKDLEKLKQILIQLGYERNDLVENRGQFSVRGGIVDVGLSEKIGVRIEFWGDEIDSIRYFNISSQRSNEMIDKFEICPAYEYIIDLQELSQICKRIENVYLQNSETTLSEEQKRIVVSDIEQIKNGNYISKIDKYFNEFYPNQQSLLDYLTDDYLLCFDEMSKINQRRENIIIENNNLIKSLTEKERFVPEAIRNISEIEFRTNKWIDELKQQSNMKIIYLQTNGTYTNINQYEFNYREINVYKSEIELFLSDIKKWIREKKEIVLLSGSDANTENIFNLLKEKGIEYCYIEERSITEYNKTNVNERYVPKCVIYGTKRNVPNVPSAGFESYDLNLIVVSMNNIFETVAKKKKVSSAFKEGEKVVFADLKPGDYVVHREHGIGQFIGVNTITADNITKDYIKIKYKNDDMLYVPTNSLDNVRKYIGGGENTEPKLNKLGSKEWSNTKEKVKRNLREVAKDLIELYAKRQKIKGFAFSKDTTWQKQFEDNFPYQETDDQLRCIEEVKKDMEKPKPMDRLLCGDVGYGKTEVAIRAAFKAVMDQKQVAYLVPTTVLANQQYEEFKKRMSNFAINVELLNRFRTKKEQDEVIKKLKLGEVDVVIGTHRILSKDVEFKDLGLLIIDEEHRFGVKDKEKVKQLKNSVDVLTMTATPIPRTLHMSILGVRDMSVIYDPPQNRRPVQTYVLEYDSEVIREAITKELERSGQVFYLYNDVEGIERKAMQISELVPEAKVEFAHGKMSGKELEDIMERFIKKEINVLVCTTILESGIDIPNANTIIVENADRLGLAQLYQIR